MTDQSPPNEAENDVDVLVPCKQGDIIDLCKIIDIAVKLKGNEYVVPAAQWLIRLEKALNEAVALHRSVHGQAAAGVPEPPAPDQPEPEKWKQ